MSIKKSEFIEMLSEQIMSNNTNQRISKVEQGFTTKLDASIFKNGVDSIDINNPQFVNVFGKLKQLSPKLNVTIEGGASAVGSSNGFDNKSLALRRATNFVNALKNAGVDTSKYKISSKVGVTTQKNSPQAQSEQYVKVITSSPNVMQSAIDNTAVEKPTTFDSIKRPVSDFATIKVPRKNLDDILKLLKDNGYKY